MNNEVRLIDANAAMDIATLTDWYISSVSNEDPVWTDEHIEELLNDFYVIPKEAPTIEAEPVRRGEWLDCKESPGELFTCSNCEMHFYRAEKNGIVFYYCSKNLEENTTITEEKTGFKMRYKDLDDKDMPLKIEKALAEYGDVADLPEWKEGDEKC